MKLNPRELSKLIEKPDPTLAAVLFYGSDTMRVALKRQEYLGNLLGPDAEQEMRLTRFIGDDILKDRTAVFDAVKSVGFFPGQRAVLIENTSDKTSKIIIECIEAWNKTDAHIVVTSGLLRPTSQLRKAFETFQNTIAAPIYDNPLTEMEIKTELTRAGIQMNDPSIMDALCNLSKELEPGDFRNTLEKIYLFHAVSDGKTNKIKHILNRLEAQGVQPVSICISFQRHFKLLLNLKNHVGTPLEAISSYKPPIFGPKRNAIINQLKLWNEETLKIALSFFVELDLDLRSATSLYPSLAITERVLIRVAMIARR